MHTRPHVVIPWLATLLALALLLPGCGGGMKEIRKAASPTPAERELAGAERLFQQHQYARAAARYRAIAAGRQGEARGQALLGALRSLMKLGDLDAARRVSSELSMLPLNEAGLAEKLLFDGHLSLESGDLETALQTFDVIDEIQLSPLQRRLLHEDKARIHAENGDLRAQAAERIALDPLLDNHDQRILNQQALLDVLMQLPDEDLDWLDEHANTTTLGWTDLIRRARASLLDSAALDAALRAWRRQYPSHPLDDTLLRQFALDLKEQAAPPRNIAVVLPEQGRLGKAASIIRDGLRQAYQNDTRIERPALSEYPSDSEAPAALLARIAASGHDLVIGPLDKARVSAFAQAAPHVTLLALNRADELATPPHGLFQFGLAPEDEAVLAADRAWRDGHRVALTLTPDSARGKRLRDAFKAHFEALGGVVAESVAYDPKHNEFTKPVKALLNIDASEQRHRKLAALLRTRLEFEARPRPDAQCIFLVAKTMPARQINPLFAFYRAGGLPVYATSLLNNGRPRPELDIDLNGILFTDIPAVLLDASNQGLSAPLVRLRALGEDAWALAQRIRRMAYAPGSRLDGRTGVLYLDAQHRVHRLLLWARFNEGRPEVIGPAEMPLQPEAIDADQPAPPGPLVGDAR